MVSSEFQKKADGFLLNGGKPGAALPLRRAKKFTDRGLGRCILAVALLASQVVYGNYLEHPKAQSFIATMVERHGFSEQEMKTLFGEATRKDSIIEAITRPAEKAKPWKDYRKIFINERRIDEGVQFWRENRATLKRAYRDYGVNPEIVVAIIGVETYYGRNKGSFRVIDALSTLAFDYPPRGEFFAKELENFLLLSREQRKNPLDLTGSYAGAMGYGQFIPSSYRAYAVDYDNDQVADIWNNSIDAIGSVANYFAKHGWVPDGEVLVQVTRAGEFEEYNRLQLDKTVSELRRSGFKLARQLPDDVATLPIKVEAEQGEEYWLGLKNFYVITRYNRSHLYAMAVNELSQLIKERMGEN